MKIPVILILLGASAASIAWAQGAATRAGAAGTVSAGPGPSAACAGSLVDQAGGPCLEASSNPMPGRLFPPPHDGGVGNVSSGLHAFVGGGESNTAAGDWSSVAGGFTNSAGETYAAVSGGLFNASPGRAGAIGGGAGNTVFGSSGTVGGGDLNMATGDWSTIGGGNSNTVTGSDGTVGGGRDNAAGFAGTIGGGRNNTATAYATVSGGKENDATYFFASVGGGSYNQALDWFATVPGGSSNSAGGSYSFAAGRRAKANHDGSFVWGDSFNGDKTSSASDQFNVYASGGTRIFSNTAATTGVQLAPGSGTWTTVSDRNAKENVREVDPSGVLERLRGVPIATWNYKAQGRAVRHMGPMAQDFFAAFGLGLGERTIDTIDPDGVALAAIQALDEGDRRIWEELARKEAEIEALKAELGRVLALLESRNQDGR